MDIMIIGHLPENTPYGMQQLQHYSFGWQTLIHQGSVMPLNGSTQSSSAVILLNICNTYQKKYYSIALWPP